MPNQPRITAPHLLQVGTKQYVHPPEIWSMAENKMVDPPNVVIHMRGSDNPILSDWNVDRIRDAVASWELRASTGDASK